ncbi:hypothetical protein DVH05_012165 [Phytophthora capsici]|nr:hypothetical protein DVH05_012165 [Phytophthora capsici]
MDPERRRRRDECSVPIAVREAIQAFAPDVGTKILPAKTSETSFAYDWGVRVVSTSDTSTPAMWMCMASETCRTQRVKISMSGGKTSKVTLHLSKSHDIGSDKTASEMSRKRTREEELAVLKRSPLFRDDPGRAYVLIETLRIINNNLPFRIGEYEESLIIRDLMLKEEARVALNAKVIRHSVVELYDSTKRQVQAMLGENRIGSAKCFSIVADFWTASPMNTKFLGLRLYLVDSTFQFKSVLLGTRHFAPQYGERDGGIRGPFYRWIGDVLEDFGLSRHDLFGSTSDGGPDVKWMMKTGLKLSWEWCVPHFTHAATKAAFGIVGDTSASKNPAMTDMIKRIVKTVYQTQHVEVMGNGIVDLILRWRTAPQCNVVVPRTK